MTSRDLERCYEVVRSAILASLASCSNNVCQRLFLACWNSRSDSRGVCWYLNRVDHGWGFSVRVQLGVDLVGDVTSGGSDDGREFQRGLWSDGVGGRGSTSGRRPRHNGVGRTDTKRQRVKGDRQSQRNTRQHVPRGQLRPAWITLVLNTGCYLQRSVHASLGYL